MQHPGGGGAHDQPGHRTHAARTHVDHVAMLLGRQANNGGNLVERLLECISMIVVLCLSVGQIF